MTQHVGEYRFFNEALVPEKWTIYDLLLWVAVNRLPISFWELDLQEARESYDMMTGYLLSFGLEVNDEHFNQLETENLGIGEDPKRLNFEADLRGEDYLSSPKSYEYRLWADPNDKQAVKDFEEYNAKQARLYPLAIKHAKEVKDWYKTLEDALDEFKSAITLSLRRGKLNAEGVLLDLESGADFDERVYDAWYKKCNNEKDMQAAFCSIPTDWWVSRKIDWEGSYLTDGNKAIVTVRINKNDALRVFPPKHENEVLAKVVGDVICIPSKDQNIIKAKSKRGRPPKNWDEIHVWIASQISLNGSIPEKQDAFAQEVIEWYNSTVLWRKLTKIGDYRLIASMH